MIFEQRLDEALAAAAFDPHAILSHIGMQGMGESAVLAAIRKHETQLMDAGGEGMVSHAEANYMIRAFKVVGLVPGAPYDSILKISYYAIATSENITRRIIADDQAFEKDDDSFSLVAKNNRWSVACKLSDKGERSSAFFYDPEGRTLRGWEVRKWIPPYTGKPGEGFLLHVEKILNIKPL